MADELEIFFADLTPEAQKKVLEFLGIKAAEESNLRLSFVRFAKARTMKWTPTAKCYY